MSGTITEMAGGGLVAWAASTTGCFEGWAIGVSQLGSRVQVETLDGSGTNEEGSFC